MHRIARLAIPTIAILVFGLIGGSAATPNAGLNKQDAAKKILSSGASKNMTGPARVFVEATARGDHRLSADTNVITQKGNKARPPRARPPSPFRARTSSWAITTPLEACCSTSPVTT